MSSVSKTPKGKPCIECHWCEMSSFPRCFVEIGKFSYHDNVRGVDVYQKYTNSCESMRDHDCFNGKLFKPKSKNPFYRIGLGLVRMLPRL